MTADYSLTRFGSNCKVTVRGPLSAILVPEVKAALDQHMQRPISEIVFDLKQSTKLDSSGIGLMIATTNALARRGGTLRVINAGKEIFELLNTMRLATRLHVQPTMAEARSEEAKLLQESQEYLSSQST